MEKKRLELLEWGKPVLLLIVWILIMVCGIVFLKEQDRKHNECIKNVPSESWFEEDIANEISMRNFDILDIQDNGKGIAVVIIKTKSDYKDRIFYLWYEVKQKKFKFFWKLKRISGTL